MKSLMPSFSKSNKVFWPVIIPDTVDMVDYISFRKRLPMGLLPDEDMLPDPSPTRDLDYDISVGGVGPAVKNLASEFKLSLTYLAPVPPNDFSVSRRQRFLHPRGLWHHVTAIGTPYNYSAHIAPPLIPMLQDKWLAVKYLDIFDMNERNEAFERP